MSHKEPSQLWFIFKIWSDQWYEDGNWTFERGYFTDQSMYRSTPWRKQLKFLKGFPQCSNYSHIHSIKIITEHFQLVPPLLSLCPLEWHNYPVFPITQSNFSFFFFLFSFFLFIQGLPLNEGGLLDLFLPSLLWFSRSL